jgi:hypothetical protein
MLERISLDNLEPEKMSLSRLLENSSDREEASMIEEKDAVYLAAILDVRAAFKITQYFHRKGKNRESFAAPPFSRKLLFLRFVDYTEVIVQADLTDKFGNSEGNKQTQ